MTEIFYRLLSEANGELYQFKKDERLDFMLGLTKALLQNERDAHLLKIVVSANKIFHKYREMDLLLPSTELIERERRALADECLLVREEIFKVNHKNLKGIRYKSISNERFSELKKSNVNLYFFIAIYLHECRGRLLEFLLRHSSS